MNHLSLPGIRRIGYVPTQNLSPRIMWKSLAGIPIAVLSDVAYIEFIGNATCEATRDLDNNHLVEKSSLSFSTLDPLPTKESVAWVVECVNGRKYLIGTRSSPYPTIKSSTYTGGAGEKPSVTNVEITHKAIKSLIEIVF